MARQQRYRDFSSKTDEKKRKRMVMVFGMVMIFLMVFSLAGVLNYNPASVNDLDYSGYEFELEPRANGGSVLVTEIAGQEVEFQNLPSQVTYLDVDPVAIQMLQSSSQIILASEPGMNEQDGAFVDYTRLQMSLAFQKTVNGVTSAEEGNPLPVMNCSMAVPGLAVIEFSVTNATSEIAVEDGCIRFRGEGQNFMRLKDRLIFEYVGIMQNGVIVDE